MQTVAQVKKRIDYLLERDHATDAEIEEVYNQAIDTLRAIVSDVHNRYAVDGVVVPANLYGKVTVKDMLLLKQQYDKLPDELSEPEQDRVDYYTAMSQTSPRGLITALIGMALITVAHKVSKIIQKNNQTAVKEEIAYQAKHEDIPEMSVKKYAGPEFKVKTGKDFVPWTERVLADHDQAVNRLNNVINSMVSQGMRAEDIANHFYPGNAESMRADNVPKIIRDAIVKAKRTARTEAAAREDAIVEQVFKATDVKYFDWVTEPGACKKCSAIALGGPYKVGDPDSPRIPESSHPNCRCRRMGLFRNSGAIMDNGDVKFVDLKTMEWREYVAKDFYEQMRNMSRSEIIEKISKNTKVKEEVVTNAVKHVLDSKYLLDSYETLEKELKNFDPDYDMAHSFSRMITGKDIQNHDIILLKHESLEAYYMDERSMDYSKAHELTNKKYDYTQALIEDENGKE